MSSGGLVNSDNPNIGSNTVSNTASIQLWVRSEPFTYGVFQVIPHPRLALHNIKKLVTYAKSKGKTGYPKLSYLVWKHIACNKLNIPEDLVWNLFYTCLVMCSSHLYKLKELEQKLFSNTNPEELDQERGLQTVELYRFVLFLYIQQINKISLRSSATSANAEWPGQLSKSVDYDSGRHTPVKASKNLDEQVQLQFVSENLMDILDLLSESDSYNLSGNEFNLSNEAVEALSFILEGSSDKLKSIRPFHEIAHMPTLIPKTGYSKTRHSFAIRNLNSWIRSCLQVNPYHVENCVAKGKRLNWPLPPAEDFQLSEVGAGTMGDLRQGARPQKMQRIATTVNLLPKDDISKGNKLIVMSLVSNQTVARSSGTLQDATVIVHRSHYSHIYLLSTMRCVSVSKCQKSTLVFGSIENTLLVSNCDDCCIVAACRRVVLCGTKRCTLHLLTPSRPVLIMGGSHMSNTGSNTNNTNSQTNLVSGAVGNEDVLLAPYQTCYGRLEEHLARAGLEHTVNLWDQPLCLGSDSHHDAAFPCWSLVPPDLYFPFTIPFQVAGDTKLCPCPLPKEYQSALDRRQKYQIEWQSMILDADLSPDQGRCLRRVMEERFRAWLRENGKQRELDQLQGNQSHISTASSYPPTPRDSGNNNNNAVSHGPPNLPTTPRGSSRK